MKNKKPNNSAFMDANEVAEYYGVSVSHICKLASRGEIPCVRLGARYRFRRDVIANWTGNDVKSAEHGEPQVAARAS